MDETISGGYRSYISCGTQYNYCQIVHEKNSLQNGYHECRQIHKQACTNICRRRLTRYRHKTEKTSVLDLLPWFHNDDVEKKMQNVLGKTWESAQLCPLAHLLQCDTV